MPFVYSAPFDNIAVTTATDLFHLTVAADRPVTLYGMTLLNTTDLGDAQEEVLRIGLYRGVTGGSGGTALTEVAYADGDNPAVTAVALAANTSISTGGTLLEVVGWNIRIPLFWMPVPELRPRIDSTEDPVVFRLIAAPTDSITMSGTLFWSEG